MTASPRVSVTMPVHNGERFLRAAVDSVLSQTFRDFELIIVNDGSTDGTAALLDILARQDARVRIVSLPVNNGAVVARNTALQHATGPLIAVMDSDDVALPERLAVQVAYLDAHPAIAAVGGGVQIVNEADQTGATNMYPTDPALVAWSMIFFNSIAHSTLMMRRECVTRDYPEGGAEDYGLLAELSQRALLANLPRVLVRYRLSSTGLTARAWQKQELHADSIVQGAIAAVSGRSIPIEQVQWLRGLSRNQYPREPHAIRITADLISMLAPLYLSLLQRLGAETREVRLDAGVRLLLLAALAGRRGAPALAASLAARALRLSPRAVPHFVRKTIASVMAPPRGSS
jgi:Glycosyl transferase family 2